MSASIQHHPSTLLGRRQALKLVISSVLVVAGCTSISSSSDLDTAVSELKDLINEVAMDNERSILLSVASKIENRASELVAEHTAFIENFDQLLSKHDTTESQLEQTAKTYATRRRELRDDLLLLQDELHMAMTPDDWDKVVQVLNQTGRAIASYTLSGS